MAWPVIIKFGLELGAWIAAEAGINALIDKMSSDPSDNEQKAADSLSTTTERSVSDQTVKDAVETRLDHALNMTASEYALVSTLHALDSQNASQEEIGEFVEKYLEQADPEMQEFTSVAMDYVFSPEIFEDITDKMMFQAAVARCGFDAESNVFDLLWTALSNNCDRDALRARCFCIAFSTRNTSEKEIEVKLNEGGAYNEQN